MNQENPLSALLDSVYELEGLIHIALNRDNPPAALASLIERKAASVSALAAGAVASVPFAAEENTQVYAEAPAPLDEADPVEDEVIPLETVSPEYELGAAYTETSEFTSMLPEEPLSGDHTPAVQPDAAPEETVAEDYAPAVQVAPTPDPVPTPAPDKPKGRGKPVLSLNDRYRFRRTLFNGSDAEYQGALSIIAGFDTYDEVEAYFYDTLGWLPEDEEVRDFMGLLENWYK